MNRLTSTSASCTPAGLTSARAPWALVMATATAVAVLWPAAASAGVTHAFKRDVVHSSANMCG